MKKKTRKIPSLQRLYTRDHKAYFEEVAVGVTNGNDGKYAGFRAWEDGYKAGLAARAGKRTNEQSS